MSVGALVAQLAAGDVTRHDAIYHGVTLSRAALYVAHLRRRDRLEEFRRQMLFEVIHRSAGGDFEADRSLLEDERPPGPKDGLLGWIRLSELMGCPVPQAVLERAHDRNR